MSDIDSQHDQQLADLLADLTDRVCKGEPVDLEETCGQYPEFAKELRQLWGAVLVTDATGNAAEELPSREDSSGHWQTLKLPAILGDYELLEEVGRGGMGVVFRARQISLDREVAVKMILRGRLASDVDLQRFMSEASATARLEHPNIIPVYEVGDFDGRPFFSMQYLDGQTLSQRLRHGPMPSREAAEMLAQVARAVASAHQSGVLHRDLKPSNIMLTADKPVVMDFGLAKKLGSKVDVTRSGLMVGTPAYMSPEQAAGRREDIGPATDVYSLGCVLYFALTGRSPFVAENPVELVMLVIEQDPTPPRALRPSIDRDLEMIVVRCLQKPIDLRYESAESLADDLEAYLADERIAARSGRFSQVVARMFRETHHAQVLENWGLLWMWHSLILLIACWLTWLLDYLQVERRWVYGAVWTVGLGAWAAVFWHLRKRMGPVTFIERQIAHVWGGSMIAIGMLFPLEWWLELPALKLSPMLGVISAMVFVVKAGMLSGIFYLQAAALISTSVVMAIWPEYAHFIFGCVAAACFFFPGYHYAKRKKLA